MLGEDETHGYLPAAPDPKRSGAPADKPGRENVDVPASMAVSAQAPGWYEQELPYEQLVANIRRLVEQAREQHRRGDRYGSFDTSVPFEPAEWLGWELHKEAEKEIHVGGAQPLLSDLRLAWDALYCDRYPAENGAWREWVRSELELRAARRTSPLITLPQKSVLLLDAMAEAADLPRKRGEATIDLTPFAKAGGNTKEPPTGK